MKAGMIMVVITISFLLLQNISVADLVLEKELDGHFDLIEDIDGDGKYDLEDNRNDTLYIYDLAGTQKYAFPGLEVASIFEFTSSWSTSPIDMNNDGIKDLALEDSNRIIIYDFARQSNIYEIFAPSATGMSCLYLGDIDNDAIIELMVGIYYYPDSMKIRIYSTGVDEPDAVPDNNDNQLPTESKLAQNYPNPFNPSTVINYQVQSSGHVKLAVYNILGQKVNTLVDENRSVGEYSVQWDGKDESGSSMASGVYFYQLEVGDFVSSKKMVIIK